MAVHGELSQQNRTGSLQTPLGHDKLVLKSFEGTEALSDLFDFTIQAVCKIANVDFDKLLGETSIVSINSGHEGVKRHFHGHVVKAKWTHSAADLHTYKLQLRPWLWFLTRTSNCRIFEHKTVSDILKEVFSKYDFAKFEARLTQSYAPMEYCVQYRESDFDFVSRLMEEWGIYYFFEHSEDEHLMVLADGLSSHKPKAGGAKLAFNASHGETQADSAEDLLHRVYPSRRVRTGKVQLNSHNYKKPPTDLLVDKEASATYSNSKLEKYDFNWRHFEKNLGVDFAKIRLEAEQALDKVFDAMGNAVTCSPGSLMKLDKHPEDEFNIEHLILSAEHEYAAEDYIAGDGVGDKYDGQYQFQPSNLPYRAPQTTDKPRIHGAQIAIVINNDVDDLCRIQIMFPWVQDEKLSRWAPLSQAWAGDKWGDVKIPRVGMEVVVHFLDGDPDHPVISGCIYSTINRPPYSLPRDKTISGTKTQTYEGQGYNELIMDDRKGEELIRMHAQKDMEGIILHDESRSVGNNVAIAVGNNVAVAIGHDRTEKIGDTWDVHAQTKINLVVPFIPPIPEPPQFLEDVVAAAGPVISAVTHGVAGMAGGLVGGVSNGAAGSTGGPLGAVASVVGKVASGTAGILGALPGMPDLKGALGRASHGGKGSAAATSSPQAVLAGKLATAAGQNAVAGAKAASGVMGGVAGAVGDAMSGIGGMLGGLAAGAGGGSAGPVGGLAEALGGITQGADSALTGGPMFNLAAFMPDLFSPRITMTNTDITISVGMSMITLNSTGIQISAPTISLNGMANVSIAGAITSINSIGLTQVTSPIVNINGEVILHSPPVILPF